MSEDLANEFLELVREQRDAGDPLTPEEQEQVLNAVCDLQDTVKEEVKLRPDGGLHVKEWPPDDDDDTIGVKPDKTKSPWVDDCGCDDVF